MSYSITDLQAIQSYLGSLAGNLSLYARGQPSLIAPIASTIDAQITADIEAGNTLLQGLASDYGSFVGALALSANKGAILTTDQAVNLQAIFDAVNSYQTTISVELQNAINNSQNSAPSPVDTTPLATPATQLDAQLIAILTEDFASLKATLDVNSKVISQEPSLINQITSTIGGYIVNITDAARNAIPSFDGVIAGISTYIDSWSNSFWGSFENWFVPAFAKWYAATRAGIFAALGITINDVGNMSFATNTSEIKIPTVEQEIFTYEQSVSETLNNPTTIIQYLSSLMLRMGLAFSAMAARLEPLLDLVRQQANTLQPVTPLDMSTLVASEYQGFTTRTFSENTALKTGVSTTDYAIIYSINQFIPGMGDLSAWLAKGTIDAQTFNTYAAKNRVPTALTETIYQGSFRPVSAQSVTQNYGRIRTTAAGWLSNSLNYNVPQNVLPFYDANQINRTQSEYDWLQHFNIPSVEWFTQGYFRGLNSLTDVENAAVANNYPDELIPNFITLSRPLLPTRILATLYAAGVVDVAGLQREYSKIGFDQPHIDLLIKYAETLSPKKPKTALGDLSKLALGEADTLFEDGVLNISQLEGIYIAHGYTHDAAAYAIEYIQLKQAAAQRKAFAQNIVDEVDLGIVGQQQGVQDLITAGYNQVEVVRYEKAMKKAKLSRVKVPTGAEIKAMYKAGFLADTDVLNYYSASGFSDTWAQLLTALIIGNIPVLQGG